MKYQLTRHLEVAFDRGSSPLNVGKGARYLLHNALTGTRLLIGDEAWEVLTRYEQPCELGDSDLEKRAKAAHILWPIEDSNPRSELLERFQEVARKVLKYRRVEAAETAPELISQLIENCHPLHEFEKGCYYLWEDPKRLFRVMLEHFGSYIAEELEGPQVGLTSIEFLRASLGRPAANGDYAQQACTLHTSLARAQKALDRFPAPARFLVLGDDDLMTMALSKPGYTIDTFEIDRALVRFLRKKAGEGAKVYTRDLTKGLPEEFRGQYDAVMADPAYDGDGMEWFLECCRAGLKEDGDSRLLLTTQPELLADPEGLFSRLSDLGFEIESTTRDFIRYPMPAETRRITQNGLIKLGYHPELVETIMEMPYVYANLFECKL